MTDSEMLRLVQQEAVELRQQLARVMEERREAVEHVRKLCKFRAAMRDRYDAEKFLARLDKEPE